MRHNKSIINNLRHTNTGKMAGFKIVSVVLCYVCLVNANGNLVVETTGGKVAGIERVSIFKGERFYTFFSIPYAEPPVGANRFMPPKPHPGWNNIIENKKEKKSCATYHLPMRDVIEYGFTGSEDCLYLSIHTPKLPNNDNPSLPAIVFLYNENFKITYNASKEYGPDFFMKEDVMIVTVQYRLGSLGFLSFQDDLLPGNNGLRDVILALKWVQDNIHKFGGDPNKVTLMGNDGGAVIADLLLHSPKAKGLFSAVIMQSGTSWSSIYLGYKGKERAIDFSKELDIPATTSSYLLKRLSDIEADVLTEMEYRAVHADEARIGQRAMLAFGPIIEHDHPDAVLSEYPENKTALDIDVPIMMGYNSREGMAYAQRYLSKPMYLTFADRDFIFLFPYRVNYHFEFNSQVYYRAVQEIKDFYFEEGYVKVSRPGEYITYLGELMEFYPIDYTVRKYTNSSKSPVYYYSFDYSGDFNIRKKDILDHSVTIDGTWGAASGDELCYLFICNPLKKLYRQALEDEDSEEIKVMRNMIRLWTNFAKTRNPTPHGEEVIWKPATHENKECLVINDELQMKTNLHDKNVEFWDQFLEKYEKIAVDGLIKDIKDEL